MKVHVDKIEVGTINLIIKPLTEYIEEDTTEEEEEGELTVARGTAEDFGDFIEKISNGKISKLSAIDLAEKIGIKETTSAEKFSPIRKINILHKALHDCKDIRDYVIISRMLLCKEGEAAAVAAIAHPVEMGGKGFNDISGWMDAAKIMNVMGILPKAEKDRLGILINTTGASKP